MNRDPGGVADLQARQYLSRRNFLEIALAASFVGGGLASTADQVLTDEFWPSDQPQLNFLPYTDRLLAKNNHLEGWLTADGLGHQSSRDEAQQFAQPESSRVWECHS